MNNLFSLAANGKLSIPLLPQCGKCGIYRNCSSPKMPVFGNGKRSILLIGEAPGKSEDSGGRPFIGKSGQYLRSVLTKFGVNADEDAYITNSLICHPTDKHGNNRPPTPKEISWCRPNIVKAVKELKPRMIITLGGSPIQSLLGWLWKPKVGSVSRWVGWHIPCVEINAYICPTYHPAWVMRSDYGESGKENPVRKMLFEQHIKAALELEGRPNQTIPESKTLLFIDPDEAIDFISEIGRGGLVSFDLECDSLKPDRKDLDIICASMSNGKKTIAFPWHGKAIEEFKKFLISDVPKCGWNIKYEHRWIKAKLGVRVRNWKHDGMLAAHVLDNRPNITGLEFQAFVMLGQRPWDHEIASFVTSPKHNPKNRLREVDLKKLLRYNSLDALFEWRIAKIQIEKLKGCTNGSLGIVTNKDWGTWKSA